MYGRVLLVGAGLVAFSACARPAADNAAAEATLRSEASIWFERFNQGDVDGVTNLYTADAMLLPPNAPVVSGHAAIREYFVKEIATAKQGGAAFAPPEVTAVGVSGDLAWLQGVFAVKDAGGTTLDKGKYLSLYQRTDKGWLLVRDTWSSDQPPPPPPPAK